MTEGDKKAIKLEQVRRGRVMTYDEEDTFLAGRKSMQAENEEKDRYILSLEQLRDFHYNNCANQTETASPPPQHDYDR